MDSTEPTSYQDACKSLEWVEAMEKELSALELNKTWELTELPANCKAISSKWVYKIKYHQDGSVEKYKARLVIRGFNQKEGIDYKHTFSPVAKLATVRVLIAIATAKGWPLHQLDASRQWNQEFSRFMVRFVQSKHDYSMFVKHNGEEFTIALVYVDDILLTGNSSSIIDTTKAALDKQFTIKDLGLAKYFLGIEISSLSEGTYLNQRKYILDLLHDAGLTEAKPVNSLLPPKLKLSLDKGSSMPAPDKYRRLVGRLLYLTINISYAIQHLSRFVSSPKDSHMQAAIHLLKYLKGTVSKGLFYPIQPLLKTKKQATVSRSSTEVEYRSMATTTCELIWLTYLLKDLHIPVKVPITLFCDNKAAQQIAANPCYHDRTKHLDIDCHFTRDKVQEGFLQTTYIPTYLQLAYIMTKALHGPQHSFLSHKLGLSEHPT
ncbi:retrovirus-related pol polyprotein from transposon RE1 [Tanacetum coccineum]